MEWIKASERIPKQENHSSLGGLLYIRIKEGDRYHPTTGYYGDESIEYGWWYSSDTAITNPVEEIEWLDESPQDDKRFTESDMIGLMSWLWRDIEGWSPEDDQLKKLLQEYLSTKQEGEKP